MATDKKIATGIDKDVAEIAGRVKLLILDVDGVMTDGRIIYNNDGVEAKNFNVRDGHGIKLLIRGGVKCAIITARTSQVVEIRARDLGIETVMQGAVDKAKAFNEVLSKEGLSPLDAGYIGDDVVDLPILTKVEFSAAPSDAVAEVRERVDYVSPYPGGGGAVRDVVELILKSQGHWDRLMEKYLG